MDDIVSPFTLQEQCSHLATNKFLPFEKAREHVRSLGLKSKRQWWYYRKLHNITSIPVNPFQTYPTEWKGWYDWLGTTKREFLPMNHGDNSPFVEIPLGKGKIAIIDVSVIELVSQYCWYALNGYAARHGESSNSPIYLHRFIWQAISGPIPRGMVIDHINGVVTDCRLANLRMVLRKQNSSNGAIHRNGKLPGIQQHKNGSWRTYADINGKRYHVGYFKTQEEAYQARMVFLLERDAPLPLPIISKETPG